MKLLYRIRNVYRRLSSPWPPHPYPEQVYDDLCKLLAGDVVMQAPAYGGKFRIDPRSHLFKRTLLTGSYEPHLVEYCTAFAELGGSFLDIGTNVGFFSVLMAKQPQIEHVLSVEPIEATLARLKENIETNGVADKVILFEGALLAEPGTVEFQIPVGNEEFASQGKMGHAALETISDLEYRTQQVPATTLDLLVEQHNLKPGLIKVDTEGTEHLVFRGGMNTLRTHHPAIIAELNDKQLTDNGSSAREVMQAIGECGYTAYDTDTLDASNAVHEYGEALFLANDSSQQQTVLQKLRSKRQVQSKS